MINRDSENSERAQVQPVSDSRLDQSLVPRNQLTSIQPAAAPPAKVRLNSLDVHRGLTMMGMICVDNSGPPQYSWWFITHTEWHGFTPADIVFPSFLFIMGFAIPLAVSLKNPIKIKTIVRIFALIAIGMFLQLVDQKFDFGIWRFPGILQRLGLCYGVVVMIHVLTRYGERELRKFGALLVLACGVVYLSLMLTFSNQQIGCPHQKNLSPFCNFGAYLDRAIFTKNHLYEQTDYDPEGLFTTLNSVVTTYAGYSFSLIMFDNRGDTKKTLLVWLVISLIMGAISYPLSFLIPFNKKLWTTSYTFLTNGIVGITLCVLVVVVDLFGKSNVVYQKLIKVVTFPFIWMGRNPLIIFFLMNIQSSLFESYISINGISLTQWILQNAFFSWISNKTVACTIQAVVYWVFWTIVAGILYRFKIFVKV